MSAGSSKFNLGSLENLFLYLGGSCGTVTSGRSQVPAPSWLTKMFLYIRLIFFYTIKYYSYISVYFLFSTFLFYETIYHISIHAAADAQGAGAPP